MASVQPFSFATEFRDGAGRARTADELEAELAEARQAIVRAREEGRARGYAEALALLEADRDTAMQATLAALAAALAALEQQFDRTECALAKTCAGLAHDLAEQLAAQAIAARPAGAIDEAIGRTLREVRRGRPIEVRVAPSLVADVEQCIAERQATNRRRLFLTVIADPTLPVGDARLDWDGGSLRLDKEARQAFVAAEVNGLLAA